MSIHTRFHVFVEARSLPSPITSGENSLIPVQYFLMFARVVVGETYDGRSSDPFSCNFQYIMRAAGRVVVGKTYDGNDEVCLPIGFVSNLKSKPG